VAGHFRKVVNVFICQKGDSVLGHQAFNIVLPQISFMTVLVHIPFPVALIVSVVDPIGVPVHMFSTMPAEQLPGEQVDMTGLVPGRCAFGFLHPKLYSVPQLPVNDGWYNVLCPVLMV